MHDYTCTGIFERHKLMFSFELTVMIMNIKRHDLRQEELDFFLKGDMSLQSASIDLVSSLNFKFGLERPGVSCCI